MRKQISTLVYATLLGGSFASAQSLHYFQQRVDHTIRVQLDDQANMLRGEARMDYKNNAPDTLSFIYVHLYPNAYASDKTAYVQQAVENRSRSFYEAKKQDWGFMDSLAFSVEELPLKVLPTEHPDIVKVLLQSPLLPGETVSISTPFRVKLPKVFSRIGHNNQTYQITQWFPKPAVYDRLGWHPIPYLDQGEFYSEFGDYDVEITLPENYVVMATGNLQNPQEQRWLDSLATLPLNSDTSKFTAKVSSSTLKNIRFNASNVHDFAWFASKDWVLRKTLIDVPKTNSKVAGYVAFYPQNHRQWKDATQSLKTAIESYSSLVGPYPYETVKAVDGALEAGGGMEYPTITVLAPMTNAEMTEKVLIHELGHNWFYGILGSNERRYPWMDEGINSYYENRVIEESKAEGPRTKNALQKIGNSLYHFSAATRRQQALDLPSTDYTAINYGLDVYNKSALYLRWLAAYMGQPDFDLAMKDYFQTWKFKHPYPQDFEAIFRAHSKKDLSWFFSDALHSNRPVDFKISKVRKTQNGGTVQLRNQTGFFGPVALQVDSSANLYWAEPFKSTAEVRIDQPFENVRIAEVVPDYNLVNNTKSRGFAVKPLVGLGSETKQTLYVLPALGYNVYDRFMLGAVLHNVSIQERPLQFMLAPLYAFGSKTLTGQGVISYAFYPKGQFIDEVHLNVEGKRFSFGRSDLNIDRALQIQYNKLAPELRFMLSKPNARSPLERYFSLKGYWINEEGFDFIEDPIDSLYRPAVRKAANLYYGRVQYVLHNQRTYNPFGLKLEAQLGKDFSKISAEGNLKIDYFSRKKGFYLRGFIGKMWENRFNNFHRYDLTSTFAGWNDYLYDELYFGRNMQSGLAAQQISVREGGMKMPTLYYSNQLGLSNNWLAALNINADLPIGLPLQLFADFCTFADAAQQNPNGSKVLYSAGLALNLGQFARINVPLVMSHEYRVYGRSILGKNAFWKQITFNINLDQIYWPRLQRGIFR